MKFQLVLFVLVCSLSAQFFISEIERNPIGSESAAPGGKSHEYIELVNLSSDTFTIDSLSIFDGVTEDQLVSIDDTLLLPGKVLLILDKDYFSIAEHSPIDYHSSAIISTVERSTICGGLTTTDGFIVQYRGDTVATAIDQLLPEGEKLQFTSFTGSDNESTTLSPKSFFSEEKWCENSASPGNIKQLSGDLFHQWELSPTELIVYSASFGSNWNYDVIIGTDTLNSKTVQKALQIDTVQLPELLTSLKIHYRSDNQTIVDTVDLSLIRVPENGIVISELDPRSSPEWIEFHNQSEEHISLSNWILFNSEDTMTLSVENSIAPDEYVLISRDEISPFIESSVQSDWFSLDNYNDTLYLESPFGTVDSVTWNYTNFKKWDDETLHRIPNSNGFIQTALIPGEATPGEKSIVFGDETPISLTVSEQLFSPDGDGKDEELNIEVTHPSHYSVNARIFSRSGTETTQFEILNGEAQWNGSNQNGTTARRGPYVLLVEFTDNITSERSILRSGVVLWR